MTVDGYIPTESEEQKMLFQWAGFSEGRYPELRLLHHIPNGGKRGKAEAGRFKAQGVKPGVPDICLPVARFGWHGLYIELKRTNGSKVSAEQKWWLAMLEAQGYKAIVCMGSKEAVIAIQDYLEER